MKKLPEQALWQAVIHRALLDALAKDLESKEAILNRVLADRWLRFGGRDFRLVCDLAGYDPDFIREKYVTGSIDGELLRSSATMV